MTTEEKTLNDMNAPTAVKTPQEDEVTLKTAGQRKVSLIWEYTQAYVAILVVTANVLVCILFAVYRIPMGEYPIVLSSSLFLVIGFYFGRTNHSAIGGVGLKAVQSYEGR